MLGENQTIFLNKERKIAMQKVYFEEIETPGSKLIYGTGSDVVMGDDVEAAIECLDMAWEAGFRSFDTAYAYGNAEKNLGIWMQRRGVRKELVLVDKGCNPGQKGCQDVFCKDTIFEQMKESLNRMQTEQTDFYILHRDDESKPVGEIVEALNECKERGWVRKFGGSNWSFQRIVEANAYAREHGLVGFEAISPNYSLARLVGDPWGGSITLSGDENLEFRKWLVDNQLPVFNYSALARGYLSGKYKPGTGQKIEEQLWWAPIEEYHCPENEKRLKRAMDLAEEKGCSVSQIALAWLLHQEMNLYPIVSPTKESHMKDNIGAFSVTLTGKELSYLYGL